MIDPCPCSSGKLLPACCGPYVGGAPAPTAEALMRSRYTAYATGKIAYIEATCAGPAARSFNRVEAEAWSRASIWLGLTVSGSARGAEADDEGTVTFSFRIRQNGQLVEASETSLFRKIDGRWFYWDRKDTANPSRVGRNDPCPCGSGKKFKACHGP